MSRSKTFISMLILLVIGLQLVPAIFFEGPIQTRWPFLMWSMYKNAHRPGPVQAVKSRMVGVTRTGDRKPITGTLVGLPRGAVGKLYFRPMRDGDSVVARQLFERLNRNHRDPFVELRYESETFTVTDTGIVKRDNPVISYRFDPSTSR